MIELYQIWAKNRLFYLFSWSHRPKPELRPILPMWDLAIICSRENKNMTRSPF